MVLPSKHDDTPRTVLSSATVISVVCIGLLARLFAISMAISQHGLTWIYTRGVEVGFVASSLLTGHGFSSPFGGNTGPTALIAPGYPIFVAAVFRVFGISSAASALVVIAFQVLLNLATIALIMWVAHELANTRAALLGGLYWACWPPFLWMPTIFWETSFSALLLLGMLISARLLISKGDRRVWALFGAGCGAAVLINMALLISCIAVFTWMATQGKRPLWNRLSLAGVVFVLVFSTWPIRNARAFHAFVPLRTTVGLELCMGNHDGSAGYLDESLFPMYNQVELKRYLQQGELRYDDAESAEARAWIASHPAAFAKLTTLRFLRFWTGSGSRNGSFIFVIGAVLTTLCGFWGLALLYLRKRFRFAILVSIPLVLFPLPYYITHAEFRYRIVLDPLLTILSAYALTTLSPRNNMLSQHDELGAIDHSQAHLVA